MKVSMIEILGECTDTLWWIRLDTKFWKTRYELQPFLQTCVQVDWNGMQRNTTYTPVRLVEKKSQLVIREVIIGLKKHERRFHPNCLIYI